MTTEAVCNGRKIGRRWEEAVIISSMLESLNLAVGELTEEEAVSGEQPEHCGVSETPQGLRRGQMSYC